MSKPRAGSDDRPRGQFENFSAFAEFVLRHVDRGAMFQFTMPDGFQRGVGCDQAVDLLDKTRKFLGAPDLADSRAIDDGRRLVAAHNLDSLTQHLRWAAGLDGDSRPRKRDGAPSPEPVWPYSALLWFWANGGSPLPGETGSYEAWRRRFSGAPRDVLRDPERHLKAMPEAQLAEVML